MQNQPQSNGAREAFSKLLSRTLKAGLIALGLCVTPCHALVIDNTTTLNETASGTQAPWYNVGSINGASGVYLKNGWVITAHHVVGNSTSASITFNGLTYSSIGSIITLLNPDSSASDVSLFYIGTTPTNAVSLGLVSSLPSTSTLLTLIGYGEHRSGNVTSIAYTGGTANGYLWDGAYSKSWGLSLRNSGTDSLVQAPGANAFEAFSTTFHVTGTSNYTQAALGDSGGGVFVEVGNTWELAGTINAIAGATGQTADTAMAGDETYLADMSVYADQINTLLVEEVPEPNLAWLLVAGLGVLGLARRRQRR
jgi:hypothetical protein